MILFSIDDLLILYNITIYQDYCTYTKYASHENVPFIIIKYLDKFILFYIYNVFKVDYVYRINSNYCVNDTLYACASEWMAYSIFFLSQNLTIRWIIQWCWIVNCKLQLSYREMSMKWRRDNWLHIAYCTLDISLQIDLQYKFVAADFLRSY